MRLLSGFCCLKDCKLLLFFHNRFLEPEPESRSPSITLAQTLADIKNYVDANFFGAKLK